MPEVAYEFQYAAWRFDMWCKGYGSYIQIDYKVEVGELIPFEDYPDLDKESNNGGRDNVDGLLDEHQPPDAG